MVLSVNDLTVMREDVLVLDRVTFSVNKGDKVCIIGANGSGKTTLIETIMGFIKPLSGRIVYKNKELKTEEDFHSFRLKAGYVFQDPDDQLFSPTVEEDIAFGPLNLGFSRDVVDNIVDKVLAMFNVSYLRKQYTYKLSGGEKRIISIASVMAMDPEMLFLDEPTTGLDENRTDILVDFLLKTDKTVVLVTHSKEIMERLKWKVFLLEGGKLREV